MDVKVLKIDSISGEVQSLQSGDSIPNSFIAPDPIAYGAVDLIRAMLFELRNKGITFDNPILQIELNNFNG